MPLLLQPQRNSDLFAPPTKEELAGPAPGGADLFAPPSPEEIKAASAPAAQPQEASLIGSVASVGKRLVGKALDKVDSYTGAVGRQFAGSLTDHKGLMGSLKAAKDQFGADTALAPSAHDLSEKWGLPQIDVKQALSKSHVAPAKITGFLLNKDNAFNASLTDAAVGVATDPLTYIPFGTLGKAGKAVAGEAKAGMKGLMEASEKAAQEARLNPVDFSAPKPVPEPLPKAPAVEPDLVRSTVNENLPPKTFQDIAAKVESSKAKGMSTELGSKSELERVEKALPDLDHKILPAQKEAYNDKNTYDILKTFRELPTPEAKAFVEYEQLQKVEAAKKLRNEVETLHPDLSPDLTTAGERASAVVLNRYHELRKAAGQVFDKFHAIGVDPEEHMVQLTERIGNSVPSLKPYIQLEDGGLGGLPGKATLAPYNSKMGISQNAYNLVGKVINDLNDGRATVPEMQAQREYLRNSIDPLSKDAHVIGKVRSAMLDHIQDVIESQAPDLKGVVRPTFKHYAMNEQRLDQMERTLGGSLHDHATFTKAVKSERVLDRIFANTNSVRLAKQTFGKEEFNKVLGDYLNTLIARATDKGGLSSQKLASLLRKNDPMLREAFKESPQFLERIRALTDFMRLVPDAPTPNPSGTGKTIFNLNRMTGLLTHPVGTVTDVVKDVAHGVAKGKENKALTSQFQGLMGQAPKAKVSKTQAAVNATRGGLMVERSQPKEKR
jgi:hypothetical protein